MQHNPHTIRETREPEVVHRRSRDKNNVMEQDQRGIKQRDDPLRGFGSSEVAARFCSTYDKVRDHLRYRRHLNETASLAAQRCLFQKRWGQGVCAEASRVGVLRQTTSPDDAWLRPRALPILTFPLTLP